tara:strand:+ start:3512 stop:4516 length:1005 start_codon:yes stop_codon:yes gene_type:complete
MIFKSFQIEKNLSLIDDYFAVLIYGENIGLKDEIKYEIKKKYKTYQLVSLSHDEIYKNEKLLDEQIQNISLFSDNKIIFINEISDKIKKKLFEIAESPQKNVKIFIFSQNLDKKSAIRSHFEKHKKLASIPCYQDNQRTLAEYTRHKLRDFSGLNQEIVNLLISNSGMDRKVLFYEISKIKSLFRKKNIETKKLLELLNNAYNIDFDKLRDSCFEANKEKFNENLGNLALKNEDTYLYLNSLRFRIQKLIDLKKQIEIDKNTEIALNNIRPKIFWKDKPSFLKQLNIWNVKKLDEAKKNLLSTEIIMKTKFNNFNDLLIKKLLLEIYRIANSAS